MCVVSSFRTLREEPWSHWVAFTHFLKPLGHLGHQKSPKGAPKAPKGLPKVTKKGAFLEHAAQKGSKKHKKTFRHLTMKPSYDLT